MYSQLLLGSQCRTRSDAAKRYTLFAFYTEKIRAHKHDFLNWQRQNSSQGVVRFGGEIRFGGEVRFGVFTQFIDPFVCRFETHKSNVTRNLCPHYGHTFELAITLLPTYFNNIHSSLASAR